jgi:ATP-dependent helicase/nuclease subunit A
MERIEAKYFSGSLIPESEWPAIIETLSTGSTTDRKHAERLNACRVATGRDRIECYLDIFCTGARAPRSSVVTNPFARANPHLTEKLTREQGRVCALLAKELAVRARDRSAALLTIAAAVIDRYRREKERRGALDYDDLIDKTLALFENTAAAWVLYKLDLGIDHLLIDEAQDTSPKQWQVIRTLAAEFLPGGARENVKRTLFAVGDEKQSIFSFQGADPRAFAANRRHFEALFRDSGAVFREERLEYSFRSSPIVLDAVDAVFAREPALRGLSEDPVKTVHQAVHEQAPGEVEIWPLIEPDKKDEEKQGWDAPFDTTRETSPAIKLAARIGRTVKRWCAQGTRPGDVLILVRQRGPLFEAVIRALKGEGIPVAGADRLVLTEHIAVMDLLVLGDALLLPQDDLALATVLKSPLFGFDDKHLFTVAYGRKGSLRRALREKAADDPLFAAAAAGLDELAAAARSLPPFTFYARILGAQGGRKRFVERLGIEANDPIDELLNLALDYERRETPSLQGFLHWVRAAQSEVKRDMEMGRDEVRVMTVHGAKGLEAKTVILIDSTTTPPRGAHPPRLLTAPIEGAPPAAEALIWAAAQDKDVGPMGDARARAVAAATDEYRRLLYVGMTRAAERLVVCGTKGVNKCPDDCWHRLVSDALVPLSVETDDGDGPLWRFTRAPLLPVVKQAQEEPAPEPLPAWLTARLRPQPQARRRIRPSEADPDSESSLAGTAQRDKARRRGTLIHRLLQSLPDIAPEKREAVAQAFLARDSDFTAAEHAEMTDAALRIIGDLRFAPLFQPSSRAEVSLTGTVDLRGKSVPVAGQIDRLVVTESEVLIADYKTNRPAPKRIADVPLAYVQQLALYRALLRHLYPDKVVCAALIWTETPDLMELPGDDLDTALTQITPA